MRMRDTRLTATPDRGAPSASRHVRTFLRDRHAETEVMYAVALATVDPPTAKRGWD
jgi:hypothetical protein